MEISERSEQMFHRAEQPLRLQRVERAIHDKLKAGVQPSEEEWDELARLVSFHRNTARSVICHNPDYLDTSFCRTPYH